MVLLTSLLTNSLKLIGLLIVFILIIVASHYVTRLVGAKHMSGMKNSNFKIIDTYRISQNQFLQIVKAANRYYLISVSKESINLISELEESEVLLPEKTETKSFSEIISAVKNKNKSLQETNKEEK